MTRELGYAPLDADGQIPADRLDNAPGGPHSHAGEDITSGTVADARIAAALARDSEVSGAITTHEAAGDPHPGYLTAAEGGVAYEAAGAIAAHSADTTAVHGITDTSALVVDGDAAGGELAGTYPNPTIAASHSGSAHHAAVTVGTGLDVTGQLVELDLSEVASGGELGGFMDAPTVDASHSGSTHAATQAAAESTAAGALTTHEGAADPHSGYVREADANWVDLTNGGASTLHSHAASGAPADPDYLVGTAHAGLSAEIVVGTTPGGELGGTWASPTVDATHSGSTHGAAVTTHEAAVDPHAGYRLESADHSHASTGLQGGTIAYSALTGTPAAERAAASTAPAAVGTAAVGVGVTDARADHVHATGAGTPSTQAFGDAAATGSGPAAAMTDHKHAMPADPVTAHAAAGDPHTGYRLESADHTHASTGIQAGQVAHSALSGITTNDHHAQAHAADHLPTGTDAVDKFSQSGIGTLDLAIANTETVVVSDVFAAGELKAGMVFRFEAWFTKAGTNASSAVIRIRIGTTTLIGNIAATLTPPANALAVPGKIEGMVRIVSAGAGGTARGELMQFVHLAAVTITSAINPSTGTVAVDTTAANQRVELTFISGNAANTYTFRNAVMYRVA